MTIVVTVKINDGIVLAADSATTFSDQQGAVVKIYNNANKAFNLVKGLPIGGLTWGAGGIGFASISTITKDLRRRLTGDDPEHADWKLDRDTYTIEAVAQRAREFSVRGAVQGGIQRQPARRLFSRVPRLAGIRRTRRFQSYGISGLWAGIVSRRALCEVKTISGLIGTVNMKL